MKISALLLSSSITAQAFTYGSISPYQWQTQIPFLFSHAMVFDSVKTRVLVYGGRGLFPHDSVNSYSLFDTVIQQWLPVQNGNVNMQPRHWHGITTTSNRLFVVGGEKSISCSYTGPFNDCWEAVIDTATETVTFTQKSNMPIAVSKMACGYHSTLQRLFVVGGQTVPTNSPILTYTKSTQVYNPASDTWINFANSLPTEMAGGNIVYNPAFDDIFYIGSFYPNHLPTNRIFKWDTQNNSWSELTVNFGAGVSLIPTEGLALYTNFGTYVVCGSDIAGEFSACQSVPTINSNNLFKNLLKVDINPTATVANINLVNTVHNTQNPSVGIPQGRFEFAGVYLPSQGTLLIHGGRYSDPNSSSIAVQNNLWYLLPDSTPVVEWGYPSAGIFFNQISPPKLGNNFFVEVVTNPIISGSNSWMLWGIPAPPINFNGAILYINWAYRIDYLGQTDSQGKVSWTLPIPNNNDIVGLTLFNQLVIDNSVSKSTRPITSIIRN